MVGSFSHPELVGSGDQGIGLTSRWPKQQHSQCKPVLTATDSRESAGQVAFPPPLIWGLQDKCWI